jgi:hypothetical protein
VLSGAELRKNTIPELTDREVTQVLKEFPSLARVGSEPRTRWLFARPGLVEILLQSGAHAALPNGALSEADVFAAVWFQHIRRGEVVVPGEATPDGREAALLGLARRLFDSQATLAVNDPLALSSLRSDRILLPIGPTAAWRAGDDFANDVARDFATARLLVAARSENLLEKANAPRWAIRAARLACQTVLITAGANVDSLRAAMQSDFDSLAKDHGERWADVPWEAAITLGSATNILKSAAPMLVNHGGNGLSKLLRVIRHRFLKLGVAPDFRLVEPVVELLCDQRTALASLPRDVRDAADEVVAAWLTGLAMRGKSDESHPLRCRVRDELLAEPRRRHDDHRIRCLGLLGPDLDESSDGALRTVAREVPTDLNPCVEQPIPPFSLSIHRPDLLRELTEAYYVKLPEPDDAAPFHRRAAFNEGIRAHHRTGGWGSPPASPSYGPFRCLLRASFSHAIRVINRILNQAARYRVASDEVMDPATSGLERLPGVEIDLPQLGTRRFVGDNQVWRWYRGNAVGPYPCISALMAVEGSLDEIVAGADVRTIGGVFTKVVSILLQDCENLAIPGLIVGTLIRYADVVPLGLLAPWISSLELWQLEFERASQEYLRFPIHGTDPETQPGRERRVWSFRELGQFLVVRAVLADDRTTLSSLNAIGNSMNERAGKLVEVAREVARTSVAQTPINFDEPRASDFVAEVRGWASSFQEEHFRLHRREDGRRTVSYEPPSDAVESSAVERRDLERWQQAVRLEQLYTVGSPATWNATLLSDIAIARELESAPPIAGPPDAMAPPTAVAAGTLESLVNGLANVPPEDVAWSVDTVIRATSRFCDDLIAGTRPSFPWGSDRAAARGLPRVLMLADGLVDDDRRRQAVDAVCALVLSLSQETRNVLVVALRPFWESPCHYLGDKCIHTLVFEGIRQAARSIRLPRSSTALGGPFIDLLDSDVEAALATLAPQDMLIERLVPPLVAAAACARSTCCAREPAPALRDALLGAHRLGMVFYADKAFHGSDEDNRLVAEVLLDVDQDLLLRHVRAATENSDALNRLLHDLTVVATSDSVRRRVFRRVWPNVMDAVFEAVSGGRDFVDEGHGGSRAIVGMVPQPIPTGHEADIEGVARAAANGWPTVAELEQRIERWLELAVGLPEAIDALVGFLETAPLSEQVRRLPWVTRIVSADFVRVANRSYYLPSWLESLRASGLLDLSTLGAYQRMVDGLAAAGDSRALRLQIALEE